MKLLKDFREFAMRGNVIDMAVGIIIGAAFGKIITSLVGDVLMPPVGKLVGNVNFSDLFVSLDPEKTAGIHSLAQAKATGAAVIAYGSFINIIMDFLIVAFCMFLVIKGFNTLNKRVSRPPVEVTIKECPHCLSKIPVKASRCAFCTSELR